MSDKLEPKRFIVDHHNLPAGFPTHLHSEEFWGVLGRVVATFGLLEETLGKAIFSFTATREIPDNEIQAEFEKWLPTLQRALRDPLGGLINSYGSAVRAHRSATVTNLDDLLNDLRSASVVRNVLCHGSWRAPDREGKSIPFFVDKRNMIFETPIDIAYLHQVQRHVVQLICAVVNTVTHMGWQFPGSGGPGTPIFQSQRKMER
jgi:hypothetical protein